MSLFQPPPILEGTYSSWAVYDAFDEADTVNSGVGFGQFAIFNEAETIALLIGLSDHKVKSYTVASKTVSALLDSYGYFNQERYKPTSVYGRYSVDFDTSTVWILKNGVVVQTLGFAALGMSDTFIESVSISPRGKYIAIGGKRSGGNDGWVILVGS